MKRSEIIIYSVIICLLVGLSSVIIDKIYTEDPRDKLIDFNCKNFSGKDFLLTGGSSNPKTVQEVNFQMQRLKWLCNGGTNQ